MLITATELKKNIGKYLVLAATHDIYITKHGKSIAKLTSASADRLALLDSLVDIIQEGDLTSDDIKIARLDINENSY